MQRFSRVERILVGWCLGVLCAVIMALIALSVINRTVYNPAGQVRLYLQALQAGDGEHALGISGAQIPAKTGAAMLDEEALKNSMKDLEDIKVEKSGTIDDGEGATVDVSYTVNGEEKHSEFTLHKTGSHWGVFDQWSMDPVDLPTVNVVAKSVNAATLNGVKVSVDKGSRNFAVFYPGKYDVTYESALYSGKQQSTVVSASSDKPKLDLGLEPSEAAQREISHQVKTYLDNCASQNTLYPSGCPFEYSFTGRVQGDVTWKITMYPEPTAKLSSKGSWQVPATKGTAQVSFTQIDLLTGKTSQVKKSVTFTVKTAVKTSDEELTVTVQ